MAQVNKAPEKPSKSEIAADARALMRRATKGALATMHSESGYPYASLITLATDADGAPVFLISTLARHTANLAKDPRASILIDATGALADPLQGARVTLTGTAERTPDENVRRRFLARHPDAAFYADFPDFSFWRLQLDTAHYIGGFGRIFDLDAADLLVPGAGAGALLQAEAGIVEHMNEDHADAVALYATAIAGASPGDWRMTGIDPEGCDLILDGETTRITCASRVTTPGEARKELVRLANAARVASGP